MDLMRRDFLLSSTLAAAAAATATSTTSGPALAQTNEPGVTPERPNVPYEGSKLNRKLQIVNLLDLEPEAQKVLPAGGFGYISGGSGDNWTRRENTEAFSRVQIEPQTMSGVAKVDLTTEIFGSKLSIPIFIPPMGSHGRAHVEKEAATSKGAAAVGTVMTTSTVSNLAWKRSRPTIPAPNGSSSMYRATAATPASSCSAPRPPATRRSRRPWITSGPIRARKTFAAGS